MKMLIASAMLLVRALVWILGALICLQRFGMTAVFTAAGGAGFGLGFALKSPLASSLPT